MSDVYESIVAGLQEAIEDAKSKEKKLPRRVVTVVPVKEYNASKPSSAYDGDGSKSHKRISFCIHRGIINNT